MKRTSVSFHLVYFLLCCSVMTAMEADISVLYYWYGNRSVKDLGLSSYSILEIVFCQDAHNKLTSKRRTLRLALEWVMK